MTEFGTLNWTILIVYILANLLLGYVISKKVSTADDFYLGQKHYPLVGNWYFSTCYVR